MTQGGNYVKILKITDFFLQENIMVLENLSTLAPEFVELTNEFVFADIWKRPGLSQRDKSLVTIATLAALNRTQQIDFHLNFGLDNGLTEKEIIAALTHIAIYAGWPCAVSGLTHFQAVLEKRKTQMK